MISHDCEEEALGLGFVGKLSAVPPNSARVELPGPTIPPAVYMVDDVGYKEWYGRKIMDSLFEVSVCGSKHKWSDSILKPSQ